MAMKRVLGAAVALACVALLSSCSLLPGNVDPGPKDDAVMQDIADAVKHHDVDALKKVFSPGARAKATNLDSQLEYFLSFFPSHSVTWEIGGGDGGGPQSFDHGKVSVVSDAEYKVFTGGKTYDLDFFDVTTDTVHPDYLGVYGLALTPYTTEPYAASRAPKPVHLWFSQFGMNDSTYIPTGTPGVYRPGLSGSIIHDVGMTPAVEMQHIANAVKNHDATELKKLFSPQARATATNLDAGLKYFLSVLPTGPITWKPEGGDPQCYESNGYTTASVANCSFYTVTANGKPYDLYFADFVVNQPDTGIIGIYALGVARDTAGSGVTSAPPKPFTAWANSHKPYPKGKISGPVGVYVPGN
jgi:hypothetical protein